MDAFSTDRAVKVFELQQSLGRKFDVSDLELSPDLCEFAEDFAAYYTGTFQFMLDMRSVVKREGILTVTQAKGVLNCMAAEGRRHAQPTEAKPEQDAALRFRSTPVAGTFLLNTRLYGKLAVRLSEPTFGSHPEGTLVLSVYSSKAGKTWKGVAFVNPDGTFRIWSSQKSWEKGCAAVAIISDATDLQALGFDYAHLTGKCWRCNRELTDPISVKHGIGPDCAKALGLERPTLTAQEEAAIQSVNAA